jgi:hypothetical protein
MNTYGQGFLGKRTIAGKQAWTHYLVSALDAGAWLLLYLFYQCSSVFIRG